MKPAKLIGIVAVTGLVACGCKTTEVQHSSAGVIIGSPHLSAGEGVSAGALNIENLFVETEQGRVPLTNLHLAGTSSGQTSEQQMTTADGRVVRIAVTRTSDDYEVRLSAEPSAGVKRWGFAVDAAEDEYFTGLMERVVDGPQQSSWRRGIKEAMNLRGQKVDMILKPTTSVYAPFYLSSRGYGLFVNTCWPGEYDFCATDPDHVLVSFEGPSVTFKVYTSDQPAEIVKAHALDAGPSVLPPKWCFTPWRWRDEHRNRTNYYDGTSVTGPFNSEVMEDVLLMKAYEIPCGVYWVDRPYGPGRLGYDDFEIDGDRLPNFRKMVDWLGERGMKMVLWIGPFFQGEMETNALRNGWNLPGQRPQRNNYPLADFSEPAAKKYWQDGVAKLLDLGVAGFKLDRAEEGIPDGGPFEIDDGRSLREQRNNYPVMYVKAAYEVAKEHRSDDFVCMPRAAYTGSSRYGVFWGGDIGGVQEGLRASIIAVQRSAVMGYPVWGSDTCGYNQQSLDQEMCVRWLAFSCFSPIMEVGPTRNVAFWNLPREPKYDATLIAAWRFYARLHHRLADYSYAQAVQASKTGMPIVRPLFLVDPASKAAWDNWWTYLYGSDILVSPLWKDGQRSQEVYLPGGDQWRDAWNPEKVHEGGQTIRVNLEMHEIPIFVRVGSGLELGDLDREWRQSVAIAKQRPDLKSLDAEARAWFEKNN